MKLALVAACATVLAGGAYAQTTVQGNRVQATPTTKLNAFATRARYITDSGPGCTGSVDSGIFNAASVSAGPGAVIYTPPGQTCKLDATAQLAVANQTLYVGAGGKLIMSGSGNSITVKAAGVRITGDPSAIIDGGKLICPTCAANGIDVEEANGADGFTFDTVQLQNFPADPVTVSAFQIISGSPNVATITTATNNYTVGQTILVSNLITAGAPNGTGTITAVTSTSVSFTTTKAPVSLTSDSGTAATPAYVSIANTGQGIRVNGVQNLTLKAKVTNCDDFCAYADNTGAIGLGVGWKLDIEAHKESVIAPIHGAINIQYKKGYTATGLLYPQLNLRGFCSVSVTAILNNSPCTIASGMYSPQITWSSYGGWYGGSFGQMFGGTIFGVASDFQKAGGEFGNSNGLVAGIACRAGVAVAGVGDPAQSCTAPDGQTENTTFQYVIAPDMLGSAVNQTTNSGSVTNCAITSNVATVTVSSNNDLGVGLQTRLSGLTNCTALNNQILKIATTTVVNNNVVSFTAPFTTANVTTGAEAGTYTPISNGNSFFNVSCKLSTSATECINLKSAQNTIIGGLNVDGGGTGLLNYAVSAVDVTGFLKLDGAAHDAKSLLYLRATYGETLDNIVARGTLYNITAPITIAVGTIVGSRSSYCGRAIASAVDNGCITP